MIDKIKMRRGRNIKDLGKGSGWRCERGGKEFTELLKTKKKIKKDGKKQNNRKKLKKTARKG